MLNHIRTIVRIAAGTAVLTSGLGLATVGVAGTANAAMRGAVARRHLVLLLLLVHGQDRLRETTPTSGPSPGCRSARNCGRPARPLFMPQIGSRNRRHMTVPKLGVGNGTAI